MRVGEKGLKRLRRRRPAGDRRKTRRSGLGVFWSGAARWQDAHQRLAMISPLAASAAETQAGDAASPAREADDGGRHATSRLDLPERGPLGPARHPAAGIDRHMHAVAGVNRGADGVDHDHLGGEAGDHQAQSRAFPIEPPPSTNNVWPVRQAAIVIHIRKRAPSGVTLARDIGLASLALGVKRIKLLLEPLVGRFSSVDRAADRGRGSCSISPRDGALPRLQESLSVAAEGRKTSGSTVGAGDLSGDHGEGRVALAAPLDAVGMNSTWDG